MTDPAVAVSKECATVRCLTDIGVDWLIKDTKEVKSVGPHVSTLLLDNMEQMQKEVKENKQKGQIQVVLWDKIKEAPPKKRKVSRIAMIPHKS